ncbi:mechanosensitive ion channel family protein [Gilvibacter sp.]|uniref:mechanosensitive ion channel family protein n=1 Tax=Gilvibacter sp. TaxID=2729997 RepID=UPI003455522C
MTVQDLESANQVNEKLTGWWDTFVADLPNLGVALAVLLVSFLVSKLVYRAVLKLIYKRVRQTSVTQLIARVASTVVVLGGLILALVSLNLGKALTTMLSAAGVSGLVIGLALQGTLSNLISGIVLPFRKNISIGDWIESNGYAGEVTDINLNYFVMREADNNIVVLPNRKIMENPFKTSPKLPRCVLRFPAELAMNPT